MTLKKDFHCAKLCVTLWVFTSIALAQQDQKSSYKSNSYASYNVHNMPRTRFTCHDKILGGYYADVETKCQMFHVCVKLVGVGVEDFRFLCPNGTAFDQEAQICADWGDVNCEQSFYGSDNFDLYRLGTDLLRKLPVVMEEEAAFHLQNADSGANIRRSGKPYVEKESIIGEAGKSTKSPMQKLQLHPNHVQFHQNSIERKSLKVKQTAATNFNVYTTLKTPFTTTEIYPDESKQDISDDILKGSHSSHFFANRNGGREDEVVPDKSIAAYDRLPSKAIEPQRHRNLKQQSIKSLVKNAGKTNANSIRKDIIQPTTYRPVHRHNHAHLTNKQKQDCSLDLDKLKNPLKNTSISSLNLANNSRSLASANLSGTNQYTKTGKQGLQPISFVENRSASKMKKIAPLADTYVFNSNGKTQNFGDRRRNFHNKGSTQHDFTDPPSFSRGSVNRVSTIPYKELYTTTTFRPPPRSAQKYMQYTEQTLKAKGFLESDKMTSKIVPLLTTTPNNNVDEDDGQYHPDLYETHFPRNRFNLLRFTTKPPITTTEHITRKPESVKNSNVGFRNNIKKHSILSDDVSSEEDIFKTAHSLNLGAATINQLRSDILKDTKLSGEHSSQSNRDVALGTSPKPLAFSAFHTNSPHHKINITNRPSTIITGTYSQPKAKPVGKKMVKSNKDESFSASISKHHSNAEKDTSYDYAYYDTDTLSESPQEYAEYDIAEFTKTQKA